MESVKEGVPGMKYFFVELKDENEAMIRARGCTAAICNKFYPKFQVKRLS
jgi:hypothetical protein